MAGPVSVNTVTTRCPHPATVSPVLAPPRPGVVCSTDEPAGAMPHGRCIPWSPRSQRYPVWGRDTTMIRECKARLLSRNTGDGLSLAGA